MQVAIASRRLHDFVWGDTWTLAGKSSEQCFQDNKNAQHVRGIKLNVLFPTQTTRPASLRYEATTHTHRFLKYPTPSWQGAKLPAMSHNRYPTPSLARLGFVVKCIWMGGVYSKHLCLGSKWLFRLPYNPPPPPWTIIREVRGTQSRLRPMLGEKRLVFSKLRQIFPPAWARRDLMRFTQWVATASTSQGHPSAKRDCVPDQQVEQDVPIGMGQKRPIPQHVVASCTPDSLQYK